MIEKWMFVPKISTDFHFPEPTLSGQKRPKDKNPLIPPP
jgi:hypothetical protein